MQEAVGRDRPSEVYDNAPAIIRKILVFPYADGFRFVQALYVGGGYDTVDGAFRNPPQSTEQILHPSMYQQGRGPTTVTLAASEAITSAGWVVEDEDTMGEFFIRTWFEEAMNSGEASAAAAGWGGDRYRLFRDAAGRYALGAMTVWDTPRDAEEFEKALKRYVDEGLPVGMKSRVARSGAEVRLAVAPDENTLALLLEGLNTAS